MLSVPDKLNKNKLSVATLKQQRVALQFAKITQYTNNASKSKTWLLYDRSDLHWCPYNQQGLTVSRSKNETNLLCLPTSCATRLGENDER